jgi:hypothetical protein
MTRFLVFSFNLLLGMAAAAALARAARHEAFSAPSFLEAVRASWWAGLSVGMSVGAGAVVGRRPGLPFHRCLLAQSIAFAGSVLGGWVGSFFPGEWEQMGRAVHGLLARRGIVVGAGIGTALGILGEILHVYRLRCRAAETKKA